MIEQNRLQYKKKQIKQIKIVVTFLSLSYQTLVTIDQQ